MGTAASTTSATTNITSKDQTAVTNITNGFSHSQQSPQTHFYSIDNSDVILRPFIIDNNFEHNNSSNTLRPIMNNGVESEAKEPSNSNSKNNIHSNATSSLPQLISVSQPQIPTQTNTENVEKEKEEEKEEIKNNQNTTPSKQNGNDGYKWRKYGSKKAKGSNRAYYKCRHPNCIVKKITETITNDGSISHYYKGEHNHPPPSVFFYSASDVFEFKDVQNQITNDPALTKVDHPKIVVTVHLDINPCEDGFSWRKYGQKMVKGNPRSYYKCTNQTCPVKKQIERCIDHHVCTYEDLHNHAFSEDILVSSHSDPSVGSKRTRNTQTEWEVRKECKSDPEFYTGTDNNSLPGLLMNSGNTTSKNSEANSNNHEQSLPNFSSFTSQITNGSYHNP